MMVLQGLTEGWKEQTQLGPAHPIPALCPDLQKVSCLVLHCPEIRPSDMLSSCSPLSCQCLLPLSSSREQSFQGKGLGTKGSGSQATWEQTVLGGVSRWGTEPSSRAREGILPCPVQTH